MDKTREPPVLAVAEDGHTAVPLSAGTMAPMTWRAGSPRRWRRPCCGHHRRRCASGAPSMPRADRLGLANRSRRRDQGRHPGGGTGAWRMRRAKRWPQAFLWRPRRPADYRASTRAPHGLLRLYPATVASAWAVRGVRSDELNALPRIAPCVRVALASAVAASPPSISRRPRRSRHGGSLANPRAFRRLAAGSRGTRKVRQPVDHVKARDGPPGAGGGSTRRRGRRGDAWLPKHQGSTATIAIARAMPRLSIPQGSNTRGAAGRHWPWLARQMSGMGLPCCRPPRIGWAIALSRSAEPPGAWPNPS